MLIIPIVILYSQVESSKIEIHEVASPVSRVIDVINKGSQVKYIPSEEIKDAKLVVISKNLSKEGLIDKISYLLGCEKVSLDKNTVLLQRRKEVQEWADFCHKVREIARQQAIERNIKQRVSMLELEIANREEGAIGAFQDFLKTVPEADMRRLFQDMENQPPGIDDFLKLPDPDIALQFRFGALSPDRQAMISRLISHAPPQEQEALLGNLSNVSLSINAPGFGLSFGLSAPPIGRRQVSWGRLAFGDGTFSVAETERYENQLYAERVRDPLPPPVAMLGLTLPKYPTPDSPTRFRSSVTGTLELTKPLRYREVLEEIGKKSTVIADYYTGAERLTAGNRTMPALITEHCMKFNAVVTFENNLFLSRRMDFPDRDSLEIKGSLPERIIDDLEKRKTITLADWIEVSRIPQQQFTVFTRYRDDASKIRLLNWRFLLQKEADNLSQLGVLQMFSKLDKDALTTLKQGCSISEILVELRGFVRKRFQRFSQSPPLKGLGESDMRFQLVDVQRPGEVGEVALRAQVLKSGESRPLWILGQARLLD